MRHMLALVAASLLLSHAIGARNRELVGAGQESLLPAAPDLRDALPTGLSLPGDDPSLHDAIRIVAADIDADGDLDVVANDGSLRLSVWENDGSGHLTRKQPQHESGFQADRPGPSWDPSGSATLVGLQAGVPTVDPGRTAGHLALTASNGPPARPASSARRSLADGRSPRAPPVPA